MAEGEVFSAPDLCFRLIIDKKVERRSNREKCCTFAQGAANAAGNKRRLPLVLQNAVQKRGTTFLKPE